MKIQMGQWGWDRGVLDKKMKIQITQLGYIYENETIWKIMRVEIRQWGYRQGNILWMKVLSYSILPIKAGEFPRQVP